MSAIAIMYEQQATTEAVVRRRVADYAKAVSAKDIERVMAFFAPELVSFDIAIETLRYAGTEAKRREWQKVFAAFDSVAYEVHELEVGAHGDLAFVHSLNKLNDGWVRWTACWRRIGDAWLIVHDHVSVPTDFEHGRARLTLKP